MTGEIIDTRDLLERERELTEWLAEDEDNAADDIEDARAALAEIQAIADDVSEFHDGTALIREDYFTEYAQDLAEDIGAIDRDAYWPLSYINWEAAARALKVDYIEVEYQGSTYLVRA